jgi:hypothetical protein
VVVFDVNDIEVGLQVAWLMLVCVGVGSDRCPNDVGSGMDWALILVLPGGRRFRQPMPLCERLAVLPRILPASHRQTTCGERQRHNEDKRLEGVNYYYVSGHLGL